MAILGNRVTVYYESKQSATGLHDVSGYVLRPTGEMDGPFTLNETAVSGIYSFSYQTNSSWQEGEYLATIYSPSQSSRVFRVIELVNRPLDRQALEIIIALTS